MFVVERSMLEHCTAFSHTLRDAGMVIDPGRLIDWCRAMEFVDMGNRQTFYSSARALLVSRQEDIPIFDAVFKHFWQEPSLMPMGQRDSDELEEEVDGDDESAADAEVVVSDDSPEDGDQENTHSQTQGYSDKELLLKRDLATLTDDELREAQKVVSDLVSVLTGIRSRRKRVYYRGRDIDFRRTIRRNLLLGKDATSLFYRQRRIKKARLLLLCDISGSMEAYSRFALQFMWALKQQLPNFDVAVFSTQVTVITELLDRVGVSQALSKVSSQVPDWSGGTNIGACLRSFNDSFSRKLVSGRTVVIVLSDGWDLGESDLMRQEMQRIKQKAHRLLWLNPLLGGENYEPTCRGMRTALPYLDYFLPAHNLESLKQLVQTLRTIWR